MATTKISASKSTSRAINYAEKRAEVKSGLNCDVDYAKSAFKATRELYSKTGGNEGHVVIQSFKPSEVTPEQCNQLGLELAQKIAPNHQAAVYTHNDTDHVHNHIVINSVNLETGKKFNNNKQALKDIRQANDEVCKAHNLSIPDRKAEIRYTQAEQALIIKGKIAWKDSIRKAIDESNATNYEELRKDLDTHGISIERVTQKTITYRHIDENKKVRGSKLGERYDKGGIELEFARQNKQRKAQSIERKPERHATQQDWDKFATDTHKLRRDRELAEAERLANEKARRDRAERERERTETQPVIKKSRGFNLEL